MNKGLTLSMIFEAESGNYGEGFGNISTLKKITRGDGNTYTYLSRQALRYNIIQQMNADNTPVLAEGSGDKKVIQFAPDAEIDKYPEIDLFGYMKTKKGDGAATRNAVVRLSNAVSLEPYNSDMDFLTNMGLANRINENNSIAQNEIHKSFYSYTITIDLNNVGIDVISNEKTIEISNIEKSKRVNDLLKTIKFLYRDIKGRRENLAPIFAIGGIYETHNPLFMNRLHVNKSKLDINMINNILDLDNDIKESTGIGYMDGSFNNDKEIEKLGTMKMGELFEKLSKNIEEYYGN